MKMNILVVDDEEAIRNMIRNFFGKDFSIYTAADAQEANSFLEKMDIHIVVSDYKMPGKDGLTFLIEAKKRRPGLVTVLMTGYADMTLIIRAMNEGEIHRFIAKPFKHFEFYNILVDCAKLASIIQGEKPSTDKKNKLVLVAHDSRITLSTLRLILMPTYQNLSTSNGLEALSLLSTHPVDAAVLGVGLEYMDGCTITTYLKKELNTKIPVIIWSSDIHGPYEDYIRQCGADFWVDDRNPGAANLLKDFLAERLA